MSDFNKANSNLRCLDDRMIQLVRSDGSTVLDEDLRSIQNSEIVSAKYFIPPDILLQCGNYGCNQDYYERDNHDTACQFHLKPPVFHEGLKGWGCCKKRVLDFDECLAIERCAVGRHKPAEKKFTKPV